MEMPEGKWATAAGSKDDVRAIDIAGRPSDRFPAQRTHLHGDLLSSLFGIGCGQHNLKASAECKGAGSRHQAVPMRLEFQLSRSHCLAVVYWTLFARLLAGILSLRHEVFSSSCGRTNWDDDPERYREMELDFPKE